MNIFSLVLTALLLMTCTLPPLTMGEPTNHDETVPESTEGKKKRPPITDSLSEEELQFLVRNYFRVEESIVERFGDKQKRPDLFVPEGITASQKEPSQETTLAKALADLSGSLNEKQLEQLRSQSKKLASSIRDQDPKDRDTRLLTLVERSEWITYIFAGELPPSESLPQTKDEQAFQAFKKEFLSALKEVNKKNKELLALIEESKNGNDTAKNTLRQKLDMKSMTTFLKAQSELGGRELFEKTAEALAHTDKQGHRYHDFQDADGRGKRIVAGKTPQEHTTNLAKFLKDSPDKLAGYSMRVRPIRDINPEVINLTGKPITGSSSGASESNGGTNSSTIQSAALKAVLPLFKSKCADCHRNNGIPIADFSKAAAMVESGEMPDPRVPISAQEKAALIRFFRSSEPKADLIKLTQ